MKTLFEQKSLDKDDPLFNEDVVLSSYDVLKDWFSRKGLEWKKNESMFKLLVMGNGLEGSRGGLYEGLDPFEIEMLVYIAKGLESISIENERDVLHVFSAIVSLFCTSMRTIHHELDLMVIPVNNKLGYSSISRIDTIKTVKDFRSHYEPDEFLLQYGELTYEIPFDPLPEVSFSQLTLVELSKRLDDIRLAFKKLFHLHSVNDYSYRNSDTTVYSLPMEWQHQIVKEEEMQGLVARRGDDAQGLRDYILSENQRRRLLQE